MKHWLHFIAVTFIFLSYNNCSQFEFSRPSSDLDTEGGGSEVGNPMITFKVIAFTPPANVFAARICLSEIKVSDINLQVSSFLVGPQVIDVNFNGFALPNIPLANGRYTGIALRLTNDCLPATQSLEVTNASGSFGDSALFFDLVFNGDVTIDSSSRSFSLNIQPIIDELGQVTSNAEVIPRATARTGSY